MAKIVKNVIWRPHPRQAAFLKRREYEALYGGAAGGGKSDAALMLPLYWVHIGHFKALILRKTYPELSELIDRSRACYAQAFPAAKYNAQEHRWTFPSGATIAFGSMHTSDDREKYRGRQFDVIVFDELTHFTWEEYSFMFSRNRPSGPGTFVCMRATTNPGGIGHGWVKDRFITAAPPMTPISEDARIHMPDGSVRTIARTRIFVPATVHDNPTLLQNDPAYLANLAMLPSAERDAQLYGSWDSFSGQVFREWRNDPAHYEDQRFTHVVAPFDVPCLKGHTITGIADPSIFDASRGESIADTMAREGVYFDKGDNARIPGKLQLHYRLAFDEEGRPMLHVFSTCRHFIRTVPALVYSERSVEDVDTAQEDHIYDETRYALMTRCIRARKSAVVHAYAAEDPLDLKPPARLLRL